MEQRSLESNVSHARAGVLRPVFAVLFRLGRVDTSSILYLALGHARSRGWLAHEDTSLLGRGVADVLLRSRC